MARYQKKPIVIDAIQMLAPVSLGTVGNLTTNDWLLFTHAGTLLSMSDSTFEDKYYAVPGNTELTGADEDVL